MGWVWGAVCGVAVVVVVLVGAGATWFMRRRAVPQPTASPGDAIDVALMESLAQMMIEAEAGNPASLRARIAQACAGLASQNQREALLARVAEWESAGGKPKEPKGFNDMKRALR